MKIQLLKTKTSFLMFFSLLINLAVVLYLGRQFYYRHQSSFSSNAIFYAYSRETVYDLLPIADSDVVFAGDSHMQFFEANEFLPGHNIKNRGIVEDNCAGVLHRVNQFTKGHPQKIFLEIGVNDLWQGAQPDSVSYHIKIIIEKLKINSPNTKIYVSSLFPSSAKKSKDIRDLIPQVNANLRKVCQESNVEFIDAYQRFADNGALNSRFDCGDGIHLNGQGYKAWSKLLQAYL
jgi:lysophospholipase L1-like esterase